MEFFGKDRKICKAEKRNVVMLRCSEHLERRSMVVVLLLAGAGCDSWGLVAT